MADTVTVALSDFLTRGQQYTVSVQEGAWYASGTSPDDAQALIQGLSLPITGVSVKSTEGVASNLGSLDVTFTYDGDGSDVLINIVGPGSGQCILDALNAGLTKYYQFVTCVTGSQGGSEASAQGGGVGLSYNPATNTALANALPGAGSLWAIALVVLAIIFFMSGGPALVRGASAAAGR